MSLTMGHRTYADGGPEVVRYQGDNEPVTIGAYCSIAAGVTFLPGGNHHTDWVSSFPFRAQLNLSCAFTDGNPYSKGPIVVGNDVWIGRCATILSGVTVGDGAVVGACAVVASDVRPYAVVVGNPAREVRRRFTDEQIDRLLAMRWWDRSEQEIEQWVPRLSSPDVDAFLDILEQG
jgi:acetyltransferase-like isoleucine patch superfamily enzyme